MSDNGQVRRLVLNSRPKTSIFSHLSELLSKLVARFIIKTLLFNNDEEIRLGQGQTKIHVVVKKFKLPSENAVDLYVWV